MPLSADSEVPLAPDDVSDVALLAEAALRRNLSSSSNVQASSITCSMKHAPGTPCPDYTLLLGFMEAQEHDPWRALDICHLPVHGSPTARLPWKLDSS